MKVIIAGSRSITDKNILILAIKEANYDITEVVCGMANGVDKLGYDYAKENNIPIKSFPAHWKEYGKFAGPLRNKQMAEYADCLIAIWDGSSRGTNDMIYKMRLLDKPFFIYNVER